MIFATPAALWLLLLVPVLALYERRVKHRPALGFSRVAPLRGLADPAARWWERVRGPLRLGALGCLVLALARPQQGLKNDERDIQVTDILLCLDVSNSMQAEDFAP
ncbi:MAG: BatA domain-containing protein, partial [bacterium]